MTIYKYFIQNNENPYKKEVFKTTTKGHIPPGWTLIREIEQIDVDFGSPLPYGENNPYLKERKEQEAKATELATGCTVILAVVMFVFFIIVYSRL